eukprot:6205309-Pleurochrysis_carterae.AAC.1
MSTLCGPFVIQCRNCRRVLSDSNQLVCALEPLDGLVLDAVLGVHIDDDEQTEREGELSGCSFVSLHCAECRTVVGRLYSAAPRPLSQAVAPNTRERRYVLHRSALQ